MLLQGIYSECLYDVKCQMIITTIIIVVIIIQHSKCINYNEHVNYITLYGVTLTDIQQALYSA